MNRPWVPGKLAGLVVAGLMATGCVAVTEQVHPDPSPLVAVQDTAPTPPPKRICELSTDQVEALDRQWQAFKAQRAAHPEAWTLHEEDILAVGAMAENDKERAILERLYRNRFGTPVYLVDGRPNADARTLEASLEPTEQREPLAAYLTARDAHEAVLQRLSQLIEAPLNPRDLGRHCDLAATDLQLDSLSAESLHALAELESVLEEARHSTAQLDATMVLTTWQLAARLDEQPRELREAVKVARRGEFDAEALSRAVYAVLRYDSDRRPYEVVGPIIRKVVMAAQNADIDPFVMVTLVFMESRFRPDALGDGGLACGLAQQHAEYSMLWGISDVKERFTNVRLPDARYQKQRRYECELLMKPDYAMKALVYALRLIQTRAPDLEKEICRYNEGPFAPCKGRGLFYQKKHEWWRDTIRVTYERILARENEEGAVAVGEP